VADVDLVVRWGYAYSLEELTQEWGRAGRGGQPAVCVLFLRALRAPRASPQATQQLERRHAWTLRWQYGVACVAADGGDTWAVLELAFEGQAAVGAHACEEARAGDVQLSAARALVTGTMQAHVAVAAAVVAVPGEAPDARRPAALPPAGAQSAAAQAVVARAGERDGPLHEWPRRLQEPPAFRGSAALAGLIGPEADSAVFAVMMQLGLAQLLQRAPAPHVSLLLTAQQAVERLQACRRARWGGEGGGGASA